MATRAEAFKRFLGGFREPALFHRQVAAHVHYLIHVLDVDRAGLLAGAAGGAVPDDLVGNDLAEHFLAGLRRL